MDLIIDGHLIDTPIREILIQIKRELTNGKLAEILDKGDNILVSCPVHKGGHEKHASCGIYTVRDGNTEYGAYHCFTCGESGPLWKFVAQCFDQPEAFGKEWLLERFGNTLVSFNRTLLPIELEKPAEETLDESMLENFEPYHPYLAQRGIWEETCQRFHIKYDPQTGCIIFPIYDRYGTLKGLTRRRVADKKFINDQHLDKSNMFLLNNVLADQSRICGVVESQFNALSAYQWGLPCIAMLGAGTTERQMEVLNSTPIRTYVLMYDNDAAGRHGAARFKKFIRKDVFIIDVLLPEGKDVNDLTQDEFYQLLDSYGLKYKEEE